VAGAKILLLISGRPDDQAFGQAVGETAGLTLKLESDPVKAGKVIAEATDELVIFADASDEDQYRKLENAIQDANRDVLWAPAARFAAAELDDDGRSPVKVTLVRRWQDLRPPGTPGPDARPWKSYAFYEADLR